MSTAFALIFFATALAWMNTSYPVKDVVLAFDAVCGTMTNGPDLLKRAQDNGWAESNIKNAPDLQKLLKSHNQAEYKYVKSEPVVLKTFVKTVSNEQLTLILKSSKQELINTRGHTFFTDVITCTLVDVGEKRLVTSEEIKNILAQRWVFSKFTNEEWDGQTLYSLREQEEGGAKIYVLFGTNPSRKPSFRSGTLIGSTYIKGIIR